MSKQNTTATTSRTATDPAGRFRLASAMIVGAYHGPRFNPGNGRLPLELGKQEPSWDRIRAALDKCLQTWRFDGTAEQAKHQAPLALNKLIAPDYNYRSTESSYRAILDPITDEVIGHDYGGWLYVGETDDEPLEVTRPGGVGVYATVFLCTHRIGANKE